MNLFKPNKQQLEAISNECTKLWFPVGKDIATKVLETLKRYDGVTEPTVCVEGNPYEKEILKVKDMLESNTYDTEYLISFFDSCELNELEFYSPLQPNEEYFVQEEIDCPGSCNMGEPCQICGSNGQFMGMATATTLKFRVTGVEVKQVQELNTKDILNLEVMSLLEKLTFGFRVESADIGVPTTLSKWHDSQYPEQPYSSKPHGFLVDIERID